MFVAPSTPDGILLDRIVGSPLLGVDAARGTRPRPPEEMLREGEVAEAGMVCWDSHWPTRRSILGDMPGNFFLPV